MTLRVRLFASQTRIYGRSKKRYARNLFFSWETDTGGSNVWPCALRLLSLHIKLSNTERFEILFWKIVGEP